MTSVIYCDFICHIGDVTLNDKNIMENWKEDGRWAQRNVSMNFDPKSGDS